VISALGAVSAGTAIGAIALTVRWAQAKTDSLGRPRPFPMWSVFVLASVCLLAFIPGVLRHRAEARLARAASTVVGYPVKVHCQTTGAALVDMGSELGYVKFDAAGIPEHKTTIKRDPCKALRHYLGSNKTNPTRDEVIAVHILTHEAMHMRGETNEATAECEAVQRDRTMATLLGASAAEATHLARTYWLTVYPQRPEGYFSSSCVQGGSLDEHLPTAPWIR
jgi:hypothetical protein